MLSQDRIPRTFLALAMLTLAMPTLAGTQAMAAEPELIDVYKDWQALTLVDDGERSCFMANWPTKEEGKYARRGETYALVTHRPSKGSAAVFSITAGYQYKKGSEVEVVVGKDRFRMFTDGDTAWAPDEAADAALIQAMKRGNAMIVRGTSIRGTETTDTYSLMGFTAAYTAISKTCGVQ